MAKRSLTLTYRFCGPCMGTTAHTHNHTIDVCQRCGSKKAVTKAAVGTKLHHNREPQQGGNNE